jgi:DNA (cytosine-5)-methyltransferase 1
MEAAAEAAAEAGNMTMEALIDITSDPEAVRRAGWTGRDETIHVNLVGVPIWKDNKTGRTSYNSAVVDSVVINPGDFVTVRYISTHPISIYSADSLLRPGSDDHGPAHANNKNEAAASIWFAWIVYLFEGDEGPCAHMHWLSHGGDTILGETAGPRELFVLYRCDDAPLGSIAGKVLVDFAGQNDAEGCDGLGAVELKYHEVNHYFYRLAYSEVDDRFEQIQDLALLSRTDKQYCNCCDMIANEKSYRSTSIISASKRDGKVESIMHRGVAYGLHDFVYLTPKELSEPYTIAQITEIKASGLRQWVKSSPSRSNADLRITAQVFNRYDDLLEPYLEEFEHGNGHSQRDCRRLYRDSARFLTVSLDRLDGKCIVQHIDGIDDLCKYKDLEDTFYVAHHVLGTAKNTLGPRRCLADLRPLPARELRLSADSEEHLVVEMSRIDAFISKGRKLRAMEVFSGAGGLAVGLDQSEAVTTEWAIEFDTPAARTFKRNFPSAKVYNHDANVLLRQAIEEYLGTSKGPLLDLSKKPLPRMPWPGEVDFLYGGPPCQDFSVSPVIHI